MGTNMTKSIIIVAICASLAAIPIHPDQLDGQEKPDPILAIRITHDIQIEGPLVTALEQILRGTGLSGGVVGIPGDGDQGSGRMVIAIPG